MTTSARTRLVRRVACESLERRTLLAAGDLDASFSGDGKHTIVLGGGLTLDASDVAVQSDGKTVIVGHLRGSSSAQFAVARLNVNGTPDISFGADGTGVVRTTIGPGIALATAVAIAPGGNIIVAGTAEYDETGFNELEFAVVRYLPNGQRDSSFDGDGIRQIEISDGLLGGNGARANDVLEQTED